MLAGSLAQGHAGCNPGVSWGSALTWRLDWEGLVPPLPQVVIISLSF